MLLIYYNFKGSIGKEKSSVTKIYQTFPAIIYINGGVGYDTFVASGF